MEKPITLNQAIEKIRNECGCGWLPLVQEVYDHLPKDTIIYEIYEKYGKLTVRFEPDSAEFQQYVYDIAARSGEICEVCGNKAGEKIVNQWIVTLCDSPDCLEVCKTLVP